MTIDCNFPVFIWRARIAAKEANRDGSRALDAILYSAIALEAFPHDLLGWLEPFCGPGCKDLPPELLAVLRILPDLEAQKVQTGTKYQILFYILTRSTFDPGKPPFQDFKLLSDLRTALVHPKCGRIDPQNEAEAYDKLSKKLLAAIKPHGLSHRKDKALIPWKMHLENPKAAEWAVDTAKAMVIAICKAVPESAFSNSWLKGIQGPSSSMNCPI